MQEPQRDDLHDVGTIAKIERIVKGNGGVVHAILEPLTRAYVEEIENEKFLVATVVEKSVEVEEGDIHADALVRDVRRVLDSFSKSMPKFSKELWLVIDAMDDPGMLCDFVAANIVSDFDDKQMLLAEFNPLERLHKLLVILEREREILAIEAKIHEEVRNSMDRNQRDYYLREQLKAIQNELGEDSEMDDDVIEYVKKLEKGDFPKEVQEKLFREIKKLQRTPVGSADNVVSARTWRQFRKFWTRTTMGLKRLRSVLWNICPRFRLTPSLKTR